MPFGEISPEDIYKQLPKPQIEAMAQEIAQKIMSQKRATGSLEKLADSVIKQLTEAYEQSPEGSDLQETLGKARDRIYNGFGVKEKKEIPE